MGPKQRNPDTSVISIRVPSELKERLQVESDTLGVKVGQYTRRLVLDKLLEGDSLVVSRIEQLEDRMDEQATQIAELCEVVVRLQTVVATATEAILLATMEDTPKSDIRAWVKETLLEDSSGNLEDEE